MIHVHTGPWVETLRVGTWTTWTDDGRGELHTGRITERRRRCTRCGRLDVITEREGRRWRRTYPATVWTPPSADDVR